MHFYIFERRKFALQQKCNHWFIMWKDLVLVFVTVVEFWSTYCFCNYEISQNMHSSDTEVWVTDCIRYFQLLEKRSPRSGVRLWKVVFRHGFSRTQRVLCQSTWRNPNHLTIKWKKYFPSSCQEKWLQIPAESEYIPLSIKQKVTPYRVLLFLLYLI